MSELLGTALLYYSIAFVNLSCYCYVFFSRGGRAPTWLRIGAASVALLVIWNVLKTTSKFVEYLLS